MNVLWIASTDPSSRRTGLESYSASLLSATSGLPGVRVEPLFLSSFEHCMKTARLGKALSLLSPFPAMTYPLRGRRLRHIVNTKLRSRQWDVVVLDHLQVARFASASIRHGLPTIYVSQNHESSNYQSWTHSSGGSAVLALAHRIDAWKVTRLEKYLVKSGCSVGAITRADSLRFSEDGARYVAILPPVAETPLTRVEPLSAAVPRNVIHFGSYEWSVKIQSLRNLISHAMRALVDEEIELQIVGPGSPKAVAPPDHQGVTFLGRVDDDHLGEIFRNARCALVSESAGGGFKMKVLTLAAHRVPLLIVRGSVHEFDLLDQKNCLLFDSVAQMMAALPSIIDDFDLLNSIAAGAAQSLEAYRSANTDSLLALLESAQEPNAT